jgi:predicted nucleic acid-binding protein
MLFLEVLVREAVLVDIVETVTDCRDPKDNKFLEVAINGQAACLISGDDDLLALNPFRGMPILSPRDFLRHPWEATT